MRNSRKIGTGRPDNKCPRRKLVHGRTREKWKGVLGLSLVHAASAVFGSFRRRSFCLASLLLSASRVIPN